MSPNIGAFTLPCVRKLIEGYQIFCKDSSSLELIIARIRHRWTRRHKWKIRLLGVLCFKRRAGKRKRVGKSGGSLISRRKIIYALLWLCFLLLSHSVISVWKINCAKSALSFFLSVFSFLSLSLPFCPSTSRFGKCISRRRHRFLYLTNAEGNDWNARPRKTTRGLTRNKNEKIRRNSRERPRFFRADFVSRR